MQITVDIIEQKNNGKQKGVALTNSFFLQSEALIKVRAYTFRLFNLHKLNLL